MIAHLYFHQQLLRERRDELAAVAGHRVAPIPSGTRRRRAHTIRAGLASRLLRIPAPAEPLGHGC